MIAGMIAGATVNCDIGVPPAATVILSFQSNELNFLYLLEICTAGTVSENFEFDSRAGNYYHQTNSEINPGSCQ